MERSERGHSGTKEIRKSEQSEKKTIFGLVSGLIDANVSLN